MATLLDVLDAFSNTLKIGWVVWIAWGIGQFAWYRQDRPPKPAGERVGPPRRLNLVEPRKAEPSVHRFITPEPNDGPPLPLVADAHALSGSSNGTTPADANSQQFT